MEDDTKSIATQKTTMTSWLQNNQKPEMICPRCNNYTTTSMFKLRTHIHNNNCRSQDTILEVIRAEKLSFKTIAKYIDQKKYPNHMKLKNDQAVIKNFQKKLTTLENLYELPNLSESHQKEVEDIFSKIKKAIHILESKNISKEDENEVKE